MASKPAFRKTLSKEYLSLNSFITILIVSSAYFCFTVLILNSKTVVQTLFGSYPLIYKYNLLLTLILGSYYPLGLLNFSLLLITSFLVGANFVTVFKNLRKLKRSGGKLTLSVGGSALIGIFVAGCTSCGFSVFALLGLAVAVTLFPFEGLLIGIAIIALLTISLTYSLHTLHREVYCKIK